MADHDTVSTPHLNVLLMLFTFVNAGFNEFVRYGNVMYTVMIILNTHTHADSDWRDKQGIMSPINLCCLAHVQS